MRKKYQDCYKKKPQKGLTYQALASYRFDELWGGK